MVAVNHETSTFRNSDYAKYAKLAWKFWCKKNNVDFIVADKHNEKYKFPKSFLWPEKIDKRYSYFPSTAGTHCSSRKLTKKEREFYINQRPWETENSIDQRPWEREIYSDCFKIAVQQK